MIDTSGDIMVTVVGFNPFPKAKKKLLSLSPGGIFNQALLPGAKEVVLTESPLEALLLVQNDVPNVTFAFGDDAKYLHFFQEHGIRKVVFALEGRARLYHEMAVAGISVRRVRLDREKLSGTNGKTYLEGLLAGRFSSTS